MIEEPERNACRPVGTLANTRYIWTLADGRGIEHPHDDDGCPFDHDPELAAAAEEVAAEMVGEPCPECGQVHR